MTSLTMTMDATSGEINLPAGVKATGQRVDFKVDKFTLAIETKGYRVAWQRVAWCPCAPVNDQTQQPDPNCSLCDGGGHLYFPPVQATTNTIITGDLTDVQQTIVSGNAAVIRAIMTGVMSDYKGYDPLGSRMTGQMSLTVRQENKLGYHDRITNLDSTIVYFELLDALNPSTTLVLGTRYPIVQINLLRSVAKTYTAPTDFTINAAGKILWNDVASAPAAEERLICHYLCHPTWLIMEHPHAVRLSPVLFKTDKPTTPLGDPTPLPIQAVCQYEFLER